MYRRLLVPIDGSEGASAGLEQAVALARTCGAKLRLLFVADLTTVASEGTGPDTWSALVDAQRRHGNATLDAASRVALEAGLISEQEVVELSSGRVADAIVKTARERGCDLIVMGTHGRRGLERMLLGSHAELVLRLSTVPVLVAPCAKD